MKGPFKIFIVMLKDKKNFVYQGANKITWATPAYFWECFWKNIWKNIF
jgi:hypothetical protein